MPLHFSLAFCSFAYTYQKYCQPLSPEVCQELGLKESHEMEETPDQILTYPGSV